MTSMTRRRAFSLAFAIVCSLTIAWGSLVIGYQRLATQDRPPVAASRPSQGCK